MFFSNQSFDVLFWKSQRNLGEKSNGTFHRRH